MVNGQLCGDVGQGATDSIGRVFVCSVACTPRAESASTGPKARSRNQKGQIYSVRQHGKAASGVDIDLDPCSGASVL